ncbi:uncharacterized protein LOC106161297 [Lingula anatina]|uniref:Uncharacterized protein LOC106161297 n=1 Tax=Lingula anatina TaxID=7574 RepID=A0A1S3I730_LINAN|nr:uncharacterized protein LOC106161297 [Lingula anatina]|eukprot:XP_013393656.1 uncharacterized protein LOC106161297 [Lingula anatina]
MGIKGLQQYIEAYCPQACRRVHLKELARGYFQKCGQTPTLVVDGLSCLRKLYAAGLDWVHGGQWFQYYLEVKKFVKAFQDAGIQLVFIFDGSVGLTKRSVWIQRRKQDRKNVKRVFDIIKNTGRQPGYQQFIIPVSLGIYTQFILKELGVTVISSTGEADQEIFQYCQQHNCFGILSQDSDFIVYNTLSDFFSVADLNLKKMTTTKYDRMLLCEHLKLDLNQLPILGTLMGNDVIPHSKLLSFHCSILGLTKRDRTSVTLDKIVPKLASYISEKCRSTRYFSAVKEVSKNVMKSGQDQTLFIQSIMNYLSDTDPLRRGLSDVLNSLQLQSADEPSGDSTCADSDATDRPLMPQPTASNNPWSRGPAENKLTFAEIVSKPATVINSVIVADDDNSSTTSSGISSNNTKEKTTVPISKPDVSPRVLLLAKERHEKCENLPLIYSILCGVEVDSGASLEDDNNTDIPSAVVVYTAIKRKLFGLLLGVGIMQREDNQGVGQQGTSWTALPDDPCAMIPGTFSRPQPPQHNPMPVGVCSLPEDPCAMVGMSLEGLGLGDPLPPLGSFTTPSGTIAGTFNVGAIQQPTGVNDPGLFSSHQPAAGAVGNGSRLSTAVSTTSPTASQSKDLVVGKNAVLEWAIYSGCTLKEPDIVPAVPLQIPGHLLKGPPDGCICVWATSQTMGIKGLQQYIEAYCPQACRRVHLKELARGYFQKCGQTPTLVVDGLSCLRKLYAAGLDWVHGGQWFQYYLEVKKFVKAFQDAGIQLVFIFDGSVGLMKRSVWIQRRKQDRKNVKRVFDIIKNTGRQPGYQQFVIPVSLGIYTQFILKELGVTVISSTGEADQEIFQYCQQHHCFGILSQDSDFIVYNTLSDFFSVADLNLKKMTTTKYDRMLLCEHLKLDLNQLPILGTLMGNDVIPHSKLLSFHCSILGLTKRDRTSVTLDKIVPKLASYISEKCRSTRYFSAVKEVSKNVMKSGQDQTLFIQSIMNYLSDTDPLRRGLSDVLNSFQSQSADEPSGDSTCADSDATDRPLMSQPTASNNPWSRGPAENKLTFAEIVSKPATVINSVIVADDDNSSTTSSGISSNNTKEKTTVPISKPDVSPRVLLLAKERHEKCENLPLIYSILCGVEVDSGASLEDDNNTDIPSAAVVYTAIKRKLFGLLLGVGIMQREDNQGVGQQGTSWTALPDDPCAMIPGTFSRPQPPQHNPMPVGVCSLPEDPCAMVGMSLEGLGLGDPLPPLGSFTTPSGTIAGTFSVGAIQQPTGVNDPGLFSSHQPAAGAVGNGSRLSTAVSTTSPTASQSKDLVVGKNAVLEWAIYSGCTLKEPDIVPAVPLQIPGGTPTLERLWFEKDPATLQLQWESLKEIMCCRIPLQDLLRLESKHVLLCCVLHFLLAQEPSTLMYEKELDAFIAQAISPMAGDVGKLKSLKVPTVDPRAVQLAVLFMRGLALGLAVLGACGYPIPLSAGMPWRCFDGKLFHLKYLQARDGADLASLCDYYGPAMETFDYLKSLIVLSTRLDQ